MERSTQEPLEQRYSKLVSEFGGSLARLTASYETVPQSREDLLQDIYIALWQALPKFRGEASLRTFVYRIAHNRALTHVWHRRRNGISEPVDGLLLVDQAPSPERAAIVAAGRDQLIQNVRMLPLPLKQVITLALEDMSNAEIAAVLGITENNVGVRLTRARAMLRERMRREG